MPKRCVYPLKDTQYKYRTVFFTVPLSFSSSHTRDQRMLLLLPWRNITNPAWGAWIPSPPLYHRHMYLWCPVSYCLITKCPLCLLHPLPVSLSPSPITLGGNSGTLARHGLWLLTMALHAFFLYTKPIIWFLLHLLWLQLGVDCCPRLSILYISLIV